MECLRRPRNKSVVCEGISGAKEQAMPEQSFFQAIFLPINRFQGRGALGITEMKLISELINNVLSSAKFFDDSTVFQKCSQKRSCNFRSSWHCQLLKHSAFVAHFYVRQR